MKSGMYTFTLMLLAVLVGLATAQCTQPGGPAEETVEPTLDPSVPVTLTYGSYWQRQGSGPRRDVDVELVERFQESHPQIKLIHKTACRNAVYPGDEGPFDMLAWEAVFMYPSAARRDLFTDIGHLWKREGSEAVIPDSLQVLSQSDERYYYLPAHYFWVAFSITRPSLSSTI